MTDMSWWEGKTIFRGTPCPDCGKTMMFRCVWEQEHPGLVDPGDISDWRWVLDLDRQRSECECFHVLNVEIWESERVHDSLPWPHELVGFVTERTVA